MRELVDTRIEHARVITDPESFQRSSVQMDRIQNKLWSVVEQTYNSSSEPLRHLPLVQALNDMIDVSGERKAAEWNHVPPPVIIGLMVCIVIASFLVGHSSGEAEWRP